MKKTNKKKKQKKLKKEKIDLNKDILKDIGKTKSQIDVKISYRIIDLFSQGLYTSPNKAIEELVTNSFDAGATKAHVILPLDFNDPNARIAVIDNGTGMDDNGLRQHWLIGVSPKRNQGYKPPKGRKQIGRFGIGKLATYVLSNYLTHISKSNGKYYATTMDFTKIPQGEQAGVDEDERVKIPLKELTEEQAKEILKPFGADAGYKNIILFGKNCDASWTVAIMSGLKDMSTEIRIPLLRWVLETAMPLRDDFKLFLDNDEILPSKLSAKKLKSWVLGKNIKEIPKPGPTSDQLRISEDKKAPKDSINHFGFTHTQLGRITGYAELYDDVLTGGKSSATGFSHGFFVYVRGRLINTSDEYFGISSNLLRHGTFARFRLVIHIDRLDEELRSSRESVRDGTYVEIARNIMHGIFNFVRNYHEKTEKEQSPGSISTQRIASIPRSLSRIPILSLLNKALTGKYNPRYFSLPVGLNQNESSKFLEEFETASKEDAGLVRGIELAEDFPQNSGIAVFDTERKIIRINALHPYVAHFLDEYDHRVKNTPLELLAIAEILLEAHLLEIGVNEDLIQETLSMRDELFRDLSRRSGKRNAYLVAQSLLGAAINKDELEVELVAAFDNMGFNNVIRIGGPKKPDGFAEAALSATDENVVQHYRLTLEAKSKEKKDGKVTAKTVSVSTIARHRKDYNADYAVVVGPDFSSSTSDTSALSQELKEDREKNPGKGITLVRITDLAKLVRLVPAKRIDLLRLRELFKTCSTPEESKNWIDNLSDEITPKPPYKQLLEVIASEQKEAENQPVEYGVITAMLRKTKSLNLTKDEVIELCKSLNKMVPEFVSVRPVSVEITQRPDKILQAVSAIIGSFPIDEQRKITL